MTPERASHALFRLDVTRWRPGVQGTRRKSSFLTASAFPSGAPVVPPQDLASRPRRNRRSATVREAFREVSEMSAWQQSPQDEHSERHGVHRAQHTKRARDDLQHTAGFCV